MKEVKIIFDNTARRTKKTTAMSKIFAPVVVDRAKHRSASPEGHYTGGVLSTYRKFRIVIPNFL